MTGVLNQNWDLSHFPEGVSVPAGNAGPEVAPEAMNMHLPLPSPHETRRTRHEQGILDTFRGSVGRGRGRNCVDGCGV